MFRSALPPGRMPHTIDVKSLPHAPGMYRIRDQATGACNYIGQTVDLARRLGEHQRDLRYDSASQYIQYGVAKAGATKDDLRRTEISHIERHRPSDNIYRGGNGR